MYISSGSTALPQAGVRLLLWCYAEHHCECYVNAIYYDIFIATLVFIVDFTPQHFCCVLSDCYCKCYCKWLTALNV
jgi:hypothetical protein